MISGLVCLGAGLSTGSILATIQWKRALKIKRIGLIQIVALIIVAIGFTL